jgi:hypothetical protein
LTLFKPAAKKSRGGLKNLNPKTKEWEGSITASAVLRILKLDKKPLYESS